MVRQDDAILGQCSDVGRVGCSIGVGDARVVVAQVILEDADNVGLAGRPKARNPGRQQRDCCCYCYCYPHVLQRGAWPGRLCDRYLHVELDG